MDLQRFKTDIYRSDRWIVRVANAVTGYVGQVLAEIEEWKDLALAMSKKIRDDLTK